MMDNDIYRPYNESTFMNIVFNYICSCGFELSYRDIAQIVNELKMRASSFTGEPNDERYTYCKNGYFNNQTGALEESLPIDYFPTIQLAGFYLGAAPQFHPLMDRFLSTLFDEDNLLIQRAWEIIGYCISSGDSAVMRRICTLPFDVKIPRAEQNSNIVSMILQSEMNEVITEALNAFTRLKNNGYRFTGDGTGLDDYAIHSTPANAQYYDIEGNTD